jgi:hypothetical protein
MEYALSANEVRVLGTLIEKELTTPEYYPLSLHALTNACNQKSNREPVMDLSEQEVDEAISLLRNNHLAWRRSCAGARVHKYEHNILVKHALTQPQIALICVLLLRGPQTIGELRTRTTRMHEFSSLDEVLAALNELTVKEGGPLVVELPRQPGKKEARYAHCLSGIPDSSLETTQEYEQLQETPTQRRISTLEAEVIGLRSELAAIKKDFETFRNSFE